MNRRKVFPWPCPGSRGLTSSRKALRSESCSGYALVTVIWGLGLIALLAVATMVGARYRSKTTASLVATEQASALAETAINLAIIQTLTIPAGQAPPPPLRCSMPSGESIEASIEEEIGKVDLNTASPKILAQLLGAFTQDASSVHRIVERIIAFRGKMSDRRVETLVSTQASIDDRRFVTILQLDQIDGVSRQLLQAVLPFVTVSSGLTEPNAAAAPKALQKLLGLTKPSAASQPDVQATGPRNVTIRADVETAGHARFVRLALISFGLNDRRPYLIREWRRGDINSFSEPDGMEESPASCFKLDKQATTRK